MKADSFKPASGSKEVQVQGTPVQGQQLGEHFRIQAQPTPVQPAPMSVKQGGDQFVPASQPVQMAGAQPPVALPQNPTAAPGQFQPASPPQQVLQQQQQQAPASPAMGAPQPPAPQPQAFPHRQAPKTMESVQVLLDGLGPDGKTYTADLGIADFPVGTKIMGTRVQPLG